MAFCLPKNIATKVKAAIVDGTLSPNKLTKMTSAQRQDVFAEIMGVDNAKEINLAFEKKLLLKNEERALHDWARDLLGLSKEQKEATMAKIRETYAEKNRRKFSPEEKEAFLNELTSDIYSKRYKTDVSLEEAQTITELSSEVSKAHEKMNDDFTWGNGTEADRLKYGLDFGAKKVVMDKYIGDLKADATDKKLINPLTQKGVEKKLAAVGEDIRIAAGFIADNTRAIKASWDNSFWGRQGFKSMTNPKYAKLWFQNFMKSFTDLGKVLSAKPKAAVGTGNAIIDAVKADIYSRPNYLNGRYEMGEKLAVGIREEEFPTSLPEKIPALGRLFKASETAYEAGAMRLRVDLADKLYEIAGKQEVDLKDKFEVGSVNQLVNSLTGRGDISYRGQKLGSEWQEAINKAFFSIKNVKSNLDFLSMHIGQPISKFAKKQARQNLVSSISSVGVVLGIANVLWPDAVEWDPRSSDFGKIKIGNTRFDITGGAGTFIVLLARGFGKTKSTTSGLVSEIGEGYGSDGQMDNLWSFIENKFSPVASILKNLWEGEDFVGEPVTLIGEIIKGITPIPLENAFETMKDPESAPLLAAILADAFGLGTSTYGPKRSDAEKIFYEIQELEGSEQAERIAELKETDPDMYKKVQDVEKDFAAGVTPLDKAISNMGISNGERSLYIFGELEKLDTPAEKNAYIEELVKKNVINLDGSGEDVLKQLEEIRDAGGVKSYLKQQAASVTDIDGVADLIVAYAKAFRYDPGSAFVTLFTKEQLRKIEGDTVIMKREVLDSQAVRDYKQEEGYDPSTVELDHIIDLQLGGKVLDEENWQILTGEEHTAKTQVSNYLRGLLWTYQITEEEAQKAIMEYIDDKKTFEEIQSQYN